MPFGDRDYPAFGEGDQPAFGPPRAAQPGRSGARAAEQIMRAGTDAELVQDN